MSTISLWPDFPVPTRTRVMRRILEEAGAGLAEKTNGIVHFRVDARGWVGGVKDGHFEYDCLLTVPRGDYNFLLCRVQNPLESFPATVFTLDGKKYSDLESEDELLKALAEIFQSEHTKEIILNLMANFS